MALDVKTEDFELLGADAARRLIYPGTEIAAYKAIEGGIRKGAQILRKAVRKKNFGWRDQSGTLRKSVRLAKVRGRRIRIGDRSIRVKSYQTVVIGDYRKSSNAFSPHAHLLVRGFTHKGGKRVPGRYPLQKAFRQNFAAIQSAINRDFTEDVPKEISKEVRRVYRGNLRRALRASL